MSESVNYKKRLRYFLALLVSLVVFVSAFNIYFNVYGLFSDAQFEYKMVHNDRVSKFNWVLDLEEEPECFILGSSNSMRLRPDSLKAITGLNTFNFGLFHSRAEDFWCMSNALLDSLKTPPKLIVFCLDDWNFSDQPPKNDEFFRGAEKRLSFKKTFSHYLDDYAAYKLRWAQLKASLTLEHLQYSSVAFWKLITADSAYPKKIAPMTDVFYLDGTRKKYFGLDEKAEDLSDTCETGTYDMTAHLTSVDSLYRLYPETKNGLIDKSNENFKWFSYRRLELFERTIALLESKNVQVILNLMPLQPYFREVLMRQTNYVYRLKFMVGYMEYLQARYSNIILIKDNSAIENFNGFENHFFDYMHPTYVNSNLMIESFRNELEKHAF